MFGIGLAAGRLHDLADEEAEQFVPAISELLGRLGMFGHKSSKTR